MKIDTNIPIVICSRYHGMKEDGNMRFFNITTFFEKPLEAGILDSKMKELFN